jgi:hypothetical protein
MVWLWIGAILVERCGLIAPEEPIVSHQAESDAGPTMIPDLAHSPLPCLSS